MKTREQLDASNRYEAYRRGWVAGAATRSMDVRIADHTDEGIKAAYNRGYADGCLALQDALTDATHVYGHTPNILRLLDVPGVPESG